MTIREFVPLASYTTLGLGGAARYFVDVNSETALKEALHIAGEKKLPWIVLGGGSNMLVPDEGYAGVVLHMTVPGIEWEEGDLRVRAVVGAGVDWDAFAGEAARRGLWGIENLSGIPGTVGAAPIQNIGAYGTEVSNIIEWVEVYDPKTGMTANLSKEDCQFAYRDSVFKHSSGEQLVVLRVCFNLVKEGTPRLQYTDLLEYFKDKSAPSSAQDMRGAVKDIRAKKFPPLAALGTAGSFFKNPILAPEQAKTFLAKYPDASCFWLPDGNAKIPAAWILDHVLHLRGQRSGQVGSWEAQALVLVNYGKATTKELKAFAREIQYQVAVKTNIFLEPEVVFVES